MRVYKVKKIRYCATFLRYWATFPEFSSASKSSTSSIPNLLIKDFQRKGLFGTRDIHKKMLYVYYPKYDVINLVHQEIASLNINAHKMTTGYLQFNPPKMELSRIHLGRLRVEIKKHLKEELNEVDKLIRQIII